MNGDVADRVTGSNCDVIGTSSGKFARLADDEVAEAEAVGAADEKLEGVNVGSR